MNIFYSWQSDLPNSTNRSFIENALERAARTIQHDDSICVTPTIDRDTRNVSGSPDIAATILEKIDGADVFVCDVSIINPGDSNRKTPNPNVLFELGYAVKTLGISRIVMVQNSAYGGPELLPFDLKMKRVLSYSLLPTGEKALVRKELQSKLEQALRLVVTQVEHESGNTEHTEDVRDEIKRLLGNPNQLIQLNDLIQREIDSAYSALNESGIFDYTTPVVQDELVRRIESSEKAIEKASHLYIEGGRWARNEQIRLLGQGLRKLSKVPRPIASYKPAWYDFSHYPALMLLYCSGISSMSNDNYHVLRYFFRELESRDPHTNRPEPLIGTLNPISVFHDGRLGKLLPGKERHHTPASDHLFEALKPVLLPYFADENDLQRTFDRFEYFLSLVYGQHRLTQESSRMWTPVGSYLWRRRDEKDILGDTQWEIEKFGIDWPPFEAGIFGESFTQFQDTKAQVDRFVREVRNQQRIF